MPVLFFQKSSPDRRNRRPNFGFGFEHFAVARYLEHLGIQKYGSRSILTSSFEWHQKNFMIDRHSSDIADRIFSSKLISRRVQKAHTRG